MTMLDSLRRRPAARRVGVLDGGAQPLAAGEIKTEVKILAEIGHVGDPRGHAVLSRHGASPPGASTWMRSGRSRTDTSARFDFAFRLGAAAQPQPSLGRDDRAGRRRLSTIRAPQHVGAADELGDEGAGRVLVDFARRADLLDPAVRQDGDAVGQAPKPRSGRA